jgi:hypothetical protein
MDFPLNGINIQMMLYNQFENTASSWSLLETSRESAMTSLTSDLILMLCPHDR